MSDTSQRATYATGRTPMPADVRGQTGWVGSIVCAGFTLVMIGTFHIIDELSAILQTTVWDADAEGHR